ncbi:CopG family ribbon-helix-helix protein [Kaistella sp.]|uniref:CopG family ribbon-helix-helix protein n=1 Tax=Kaistella sp. TaxID=2782235 RepID=UPI00359FC3BF
MTTATNQKQTTSIKLDMQTKQALKRFAKQENRSVHYLLVSAVKDFVKRKQEEDEYQEYIKKRVLASENRLHTQGADNLTKDQIKASIKQFLINNK